MDQKHILELNKQYRQGLDETSSFWLGKSKGYLDFKYGGYCHAVDQDGTQIDSDKSVWAQGRNAWLWATLYNKIEKLPEWEQAAQVGIDFLDVQGFDRHDNRMWFHTMRDGTPIRKRRYAFSESFAAIAYASYAKMVGSDLYADKALACLETFVNHKAEAKFTEARPTIGMGSLMIAITTAQTLRDNIKFEGADVLIDRCIDDIEKYFVKDDLAVVMEQVAPDGSVIEHFDGMTLNPGHAIEGAWFILQEAKYRNNDKRLIALGCRMLDYMWQRGWDEEHGGILYFTSLHGTPVQEYWHDMKFWWPHNETIIATLLAYQLTGDMKYAEWHTKVNNWAYKYFHDKKHGEWFGYLHRDGSLSSTLKGNLWKSPFHLPRMQLECLKITDQMLAGAVLNS